MLWEGVPLTPKNVTVANATRREISFQAVKSLV